MRRLVPLLVALVALAALAPAASAAAQVRTGIAQIVGPDGTVIARSDVRAGWSYPEDGSIVQISDAYTTGGELRLIGVSALGGRVYADGLAVGRGPRAVGLDVDGVAVDPDPSTPFLLPDVGWGMLLQQAVIPGNDGRARRTAVALRVHLDAAVGSLPAGSEILIGYLAGTLSIAPDQETLAGAAADIPAELVPLYRAAGRRYGVPWSVLAAIGKVESDHGRSNEQGVHSGVNSYGCCAGPMQFSIPPAYDTWGAYGVDGNGDGAISVYDPADAIPAAANMLRTNGARTNLAGAVYLYNHAWWYVQRVLDLAKAYEAGADEPAPISPEAGVSRAGTRLSPGVDAVTLG